MKIRKLCFSVLIGSLTWSLLNVNAAQAESLAGTITIEGNQTDLSGEANGANGNRLGGFVSDLYYDRNQNVYYGLSDRGPGGGVYSYNTRAQKFTLDVNPQTGAISDFQLIETIPFKNGNSNYNGLNPLKLNGSVSNLGLSFDSEGFAVAPNGNFYVSDEYGPSVYEFSSQGQLIRGFNTPNNLIPKTSDGVADYLNGRDTITSGRQDNRGFEGLAISPDGSKIFAMLQDPLVNEGQNNDGDPDGRYSRNLRIVEFDTDTGNSTAQYIYQLESLSTINSRVNSEPFDANQQGRSIGISSIIALNNEEFLVLERDNRGIGVEAPTEADVDDNPVATKRVYKINLNNATDVSNISLAGTNDLTNITSVTKTLFLDIQSILEQQNQLVPEKLEGLAIGPQLADGDYAILLGSDNDYSVTQNDSEIQFDVCTNITNESFEVPLNSACPLDSLGQQTSLIPSYLYSIKADIPSSGQEIPEPLTFLGTITALGFGSFFKNKRAK